MGPLTVALEVFVLHYRNRGSLRVLSLDTKGVTDQEPPRYTGLMCDGRFGLTLVSTSPTSFGEGL